MRRGHSEADRKFMKPGSAGRMASPVLPMNGPREMAMTRNMRRFPKAPRHIGRR